MIPEAPLVETEAGLQPGTDGWFVINAANAAWLTNDTFRAACVFERREAPFADVGFTLAVLEPGTPSGLYHRESNQEDFLVLRGECLLLVEGEERRLRAWDFVHCPPGTEHAFAGAGDGPCVIFMTGARGPNRQIAYPRSELALKHGAGVEAETDSPREAYAPFPHWRPGRPAGEAALPWNAPQAD